MTWEIVVGIGTLIGMFATVIGVAVKLSNSITTLQASINSFSETLKTFQQDNKENHKEFYSRLNNHEGRIIKLEDRQSQDRHGNSEHPCS